MGEKNDGVITVDKVTFTGASIDHIEIGECTEEPEITDGAFRMLNNAEAEFSCSIKMASDIFTRFVHTVLGIKDDLEANCPNRRVVHLSKHAKKERVRKKNYNRMIRMAEKGN